MKTWADDLYKVLAAFILLGIAITLYLCFVLVNVKIVKWFWYL